RPVLLERSKPKWLDLKAVVGDGWLCALCAPGSGVWVGDRGCVFGAGAETVIADSFWRGGRGVKNKGGGGWGGRKRLDGPLCLATSHNGGVGPAIARLVRFVWAAVPGTGPGAPFVTASIPAWRR